MLAIAYRHHFPVASPSPLLKKAYHLYHKLSFLSRKNMQQKSITRAIA